MAVVAHYLGEVSLSHASALDVLNFAPDYFVDVDGEGDRSLAHLNAANKSLNPTTVMTRFREVQDVCHSADVLFLNFMIDEADLLLCVFRLSAPVMCHLTKPLWRNIDVLDPRVKYDCLTAELSNVSFSRDSWPLLA